MSSKLHQFLVGAASSREKKSLYSYHRGWKPLPQSKSHKLPLLNLLGFKEVSFSIRPAVFLAGGWADTCPLSSDFHLWRHPDIVSNIQFNRIAHRSQINRPEGFIGPAKSPIWNPVFKLDMTISGQHNHDIIF
jgi:hypothetical protein